MGLCGYHHSSYGLGRRGAPYSTYFRTPGVQHRWGPACLGTLFGGLSPTQPSFLVYMDCVDVVRSSGALANDTPSFIQRCRLACDRIKRPLHAGNRVVRVSFAPSLDAEIVGTHGVLRHSRDKGQSLIFTILALLGHSRSMSALQHCVGLSTFAAGFRRPLFSFF